MNKLFKRVPFSHMPHNVNALYEQEQQREPRWHRVWHTIARRQELQCDEQHIVTQKLYHEIEQLQKHMETQTYLLHKLIAMGMAEEDNHDER